MISHSTSPIRKQRVKKKARSITSTKLVYDLTHDGILVEIKGGGSEHIDLTGCSSEHIDLTGGGGEHIDLTDLTGDD